MKKSMSSFDRYYISPALVSDIEHRSECVPYYNAFYSDEQGGWCLSGAHLPIFVAPMACIIDEHNYMEFDNEGLNPIIPRTVDFQKRLEIMKSMIWIAVGLDEFDWIINNYERFDSEVYICVDIANGHMRKLLDKCKQAKLKFGQNLNLMAGNIANPYTYIEYAKAGIDYVRCTIGDGQACATADLTGISQDTPEFINDVIKFKTLVTESFIENKKYLSIPKIVIDGGISKIRDIVVALALDADYVMCGKIFAKSEEACGERFDKLMPVTREEICDTCIPKKINAITVSEWIPGRMYYGMSTQRAQKEMGNKRLKSSEGYEYWVPIEYKLSDWVKQFVNAIASTMSYCNCTQLGEFIGKVTLLEYKN